MAGDPGLALDERVLRDVERALRVEHVQVVRESALVLVRRERDRLIRREDGLALAVACLLVSGDPRDGVGGAGLPRDG